ncbi:hypothetical protein LVJ94_34920 [Pendulispora rubella]|uniref:Uncharacterized protein n=1 Tax=Pendulispora rubella TaxID=2741070 RepID=A0ABZ2KTV5_9BACT
MLDTFLEVAYAHEARRHEERGAIDLLKRLPEADLRKMASGEVLANAGDFLSQFRGTPLIEQALALEEEELQAEMADAERQKERRMESQVQDAVWGARDALRIKKRLLELELAKEEAGITAGPAAAAPPSMPQTPEPPEPPVADAQGTEAIEPAAAGKAGETSVGKMAGVTAPFADALGRELAQSDFRKAAAAMDIVRAGEAAGRILAKHAAVPRWAQDPKKRRTMKALGVGLLAAGPAGVLLGHHVAEPLGGRVGRALFPRGKGKEEGDEARASKQASTLGALTGALKGVGPVASNALKAVAPVASNFIRDPRNMPTLVSAGTGAIGGLAHGLQRDEHGQRHVVRALGQGLGAGAVAGALGHAGGHLGRAVAAGGGVGDALKSYGQGWANAVGRVAESARGVGAAIQQNAAGAVKQAGTKEILRWPFISKPMGAVLDGTGSMDQLSDQERTRVEALQRLRARVGYKKPDSA